MAHTPGPWLYREPDADELHEIYADFSGDLICYPVWTHNQKANIPLIAAAPEMLDALYSSLASLRWLTEWRTHDATACDQEIEYEIGRISKLIAKAEGRDE